MIATIATILAFAPALLTMGAVLLLVPILVGMAHADATRPVDGPVMPGWALALSEALDDEEEASALDWPILTPRTPEDGVRPMRTIAGRWVGRPWTPVRYPMRRGTPHAKGRPYAGMAHASPVIPRGCRRGSSSPVGLARSRKCAESLENSARGPPPPPGAGLG